MGKATRQAVRIQHEGTPSEASSRVSVTPRSGVQVVATRAPEVGTSTLKQNAALMERLRQVAMRSDRPVAMPKAVATLEIEPISVRQPEVAHVKTSDVEMVEDTTPNTPARPFPLATPRLSSFLAPEAISTPPAPEPSEEPATNVEPSSRRAKERVQAQVQTSDKKPMRLFGAVAVALAVVAVAAGAGMHLRDSHRDNVTTSRIP